MEFKIFKKRLQENFEKLTANQTHLFEVDLDKDTLWNLYLDSFPEGSNNVFRERREYDCSCCRQFIKNIGNVVSIENNQIKTIWEFEAGSDIFQPVVDALDKFVKSHTIDSVWVSKFKKIGTDKNFEETKEKVIEWTHLYLELDNKFVDNSQRSIGDIQGSFRDIRNVFKRSLEEITEESVETVLELISQNSLYKGEEWKSQLTEFSKLQKEYNKLPQNEKDLYTWLQSTKVGVVIGKIRNHSIGTLLINIDSGMDLDQAVKKYEVIVAPSNYKRPKAIYTKKMLEDAQKTLQELGYIDSLKRRYATIDDITVNNILFFNKDLSKQFSELDIFDEMNKSIPLDIKKFSRVEEVGVDKFINDIMPKSKEIEVMVENRHSGNFVSLIAPEIKDSKTMFKWDNNFGWSYSGNITDTQIKNRVKAAGGKVDGVLRFSIQWNDEDYNPNDFDAHCKEPNGNEIFFGNNKNHRTTGNLDVDIISPQRNQPAVENITWIDKNRMETGTYTFFVENYFNAGGRSGFKAEIEFDGNIYSFEYDKELKNKEKVIVAEVVLDNNGMFAIKEKLNATTSSKDVWGVKTNQFTPVSVIMYSPNYWNEQQGIGNKHLFFMLKDCINPENPNGFFNEFLKNDLDKHKRVFEALGSRMAVKESTEQLSGIGFSSTLRNDLIVKVRGNSERILKIKF